MTATVRPASHPMIRPANQRPAGGAVAASPTVIRPRQDSALFRGWGVTL